MKIENIAVKKIMASVINPRLDIASSDIESLKASLLSVGMLVPILLRKEGQMYTVQAGHRRLEAAKALDWDDVPAYVLDQLNSPASDAIVHIIENEQRKDLSPVEKGIAVTRTVSAGFNQSAISKAVSRSAKWVSMFNTIGKFYEKQSDEIKTKMAEYTDADALYAFCKPTKIKEPAQTDLVDEAAEQKREQDETTLQQKIAEFMGTTFDNVSVAIDPSGNCVVAISFANQKDAEAFFSEGAERA